VKERVLHIHKPQHCQVMRAAKVHEANALSRISLQSKRYWKYPEEYYQVWAKELLVTAEYIRNNVVFVCEEQGEAVAYYSIVLLEDNITISGIELSKGHWLDHMFVSPHLIGKGLGRQMFDHLNIWCLSTSVKTIHVLADPHSGGFYEKMGCEYQHEHPSTIPGRTTPLFVFRPRAC
jgi:GNAT superfamily N-acetyltransferase